MWPRMINWLRSSSAAFFAEIFFIYNPLLAHDVLLLYTVRQTQTLMQNPWATNICNDSSGLVVVYRYAVPMPKLMSRRDLDRY